MELSCPPYWLTSSMCGFLPTRFHPKVTSLSCQVICEGWAWQFMTVNRPRCRAALPCLHSPLLAHLYFLSAPSLLSEHPEFSPSSQYFLVVLSTPS